MEHPHGPQPSPLQRAKSHERIATYSIAVIVAVIVILVVRTIAIAGSESAADQQRLANAIVPVVQLIISLTMLALIRNQVSVAVGQIEQAEQSEARLLQLAAAVHALVDSLGSPGRAEHRTARGATPAKAAGPSAPRSAERELVLAGTRKSRLRVSSLG